MRTIHCPPVFLPPRQIIAPEVLKLEREWVLQRNDSIRISNASIMTARRMRSHYETFKCVPPDRELSPLLPMPNADGSYTPVLE